MAGINTAHIKINTGRLRSMRGQMGAKVVAAIQSADIAIEHIKDAFGLSGKIGEISVKNVVDGSSLLKLRDAVVEIIRDEDTYNVSIATAQLDEAVETFQGFFNDELIINGGVELNESLEARLNETESYKAATDKREKLKEDVSNLMSEVIDDQGKIKGSWVKLFESCEVFLKAYFFAKEVLELEKDESLAMGKDYLKKSIQTYQSSASFTAEEVKGLVGLIASKLPSNLDQGLSLSA